MNFFYFFLYGCCCLVSGYITSCFFEDKIRELYAKWRMYQ